nr:unnamed protein product [Callosobruchus chinensis]
MNHRMYKPVSTSMAVPDKFNGVAQKIVTSTLKMEDEDGRKNFNRNSQATRHVVKMLVAVVVAFFICWAPFHAQRLLAIYGEQTSQTITAFEVLTYISGVFYYLSTTVNPLLYHIMSNKYKAAFKATYKQCCGGGRSHNDYNRRCHHHNNSPNALGRCYSTLSRRSSGGHSNSHSNTDSCSRSEFTTQQRPLEAEMACLHHPGRPLAVSFRRENRRPRDHQWSFGRDTQQSVTDNNINGKGSIGDSFAAVHQLRPVHTCPLMAEATL